MAEARARLWVLIGAVAATLLLHALPYGAYVGYPLVLLSTFAHEMGHGLAAVAVGGTLESLTLSADASGSARLTLPPSRLARAAAAAGGLLGPAALAALFFALSRRVRTARMALAVFALLSGLAALLWVRSLVGILFVSLLALACLWVANRAEPRTARWVLVFLAVQLAASVFSRGSYLFARTAGSAPSDVAVMADALALPYWFWGMVSGAVSVVVLAVGVRSFLRSA